MIIAVRRNIMKSIRTSIFSFNNGGLYCVGETEAIQDLINYFQLRANSGEYIAMDNFIDRVIQNQVYAYLQADRLVEKLHAVFIIKRKLKKCGLLISPLQYTQALYLTQPEATVKSMRLSKKNEEELKDGCKFWKEKLSE